MYIVKHGDTTDSNTGGILAVISSLGSIIEKAIGGDKEATPVAITQEKSSISSNLEWLLPTGLLLIVIISIVSMSKR